MTTATTADLQKNLVRYLRITKKEPVVVTQAGKPVALLIQPDDDILYEWKLVKSPRFLAILAEGQRQIEAGECSTHEEFWKRVKAETSRRQKGKRAQATVR
jgi:PHD/YefM family antitoxin component YafN of YafNO toxin-antitoxin module